VNENDLRDRRLVEVGCGKGYFLRKLVSLDPANTGVGFDPSYSGPESDLDGRIRFERRFYGPDCAVPADAVVCRHVIEHVEDPVALLQSVRGALEQSPAALVFFETPCVEWILHGGVVWDFFYEHCSLFSEHSLASAFAAAGFSVRRTRRLFGDQYLWVEGEPVADWRMRRWRGRVLELARRFASTEASIKHALVGKLSDLGRNSGGIALWGAGAKGSTLANLADPERHIFDCVVDINPSKHGCFVPGTGHPIVDFRELPRRGVRHAVLTNPNYRSEINELLARADVDVALLELETR
jgi:SAM-dependent methyltransferase